LGKLLRGLTLLGGVAGIAYALKSYLTRSAETGGGSVQLSFEDGTSDTLVSAEAEELADIAGAVLRSSGR
jgi:hypothetical protein